MYSGERIDPNYGTIPVRDALARSDYLALTAALRRRFRDGIQFQAVPGSSRQFQAHYTWSRDRSNDDDERSSGDLTLTDPADPDYDWGLSSRDIPQWGFPLLRIARRRGEHLVAQLGLRIVF